VEHLREGQFVTHPTANNQGTISWSTQGKPVGGNENGYITATIKFGNKTAAANFGWNNPTFGPLGCKVNIDPPLTGILKPSCIIENGITAYAFYCIDGTPLRPHGSPDYNACSVSHNNPHQSQSKR